MGGGFAKKRIILLTVLAVLIALAAFLMLDRGGNIRGVDRIIGESSIYTEEEIRAAMDVAEQKFKKDFEGCRLLRMEYDEEKTLSEQSYWTERCGADRAIILVSDFYAGKDADGGFDQHHTYKNWSWILTDDGQGWVLRTSGYG